MPDGWKIEPRAGYRSMAEGTKDDYDIVFGHFKTFERDLASRILRTLEQLEHSYPGELVNRLVTRCKPQPARTAPATTKSTSWRPCCMTWATCWGR